nr:ribosomal protein L7/L12 [uncultured Psychroserpens sp.]
MHNYLNTYKDYFWHWDCDNADINNRYRYIATIRDGQSIAYYPKIFEVLEDLQHQGLPPFGAILLVLIATNQNIDDVTSNHLERILLGIDGSKTTLNAIEVLDLIKSLPYRLKTGSNLTLLFQTLFKDCHNRMGIPKSKEFINNLQNDHYNFYLTTNTPEGTDQTNIATFNKDVRAIALLIRRFKSVDDISNAMQNIPKNDLESTVILEDTISNENEIDKSFIKQLTEHKSTYQIGSLIKRIWSGLDIPMHNNLPSTQPLGGVSDIINKGDFSRLLISEFAYEDDTFMSRIANNEALYIERETPPESNNKHRVFLIDASLKNWGIPKVLSFATSLAIAQHPKSNYKYSAFVVGQDYEEAPIETLYDVIESQQILSGGLQPSLGLSKYFKDNNDDSNRELFFLTETKNLDHPDLQNVLYQYHEQFNYIITTHTSGTLNFYKHQNRSRKQFQQIVLPYQEIWDNNRPLEVHSKPITSSDIDIKHVLLEPIDVTSKIIPFEETYYVVQNANVYTLTSAGYEKGLQMIMEDIPYSQDYRYTIVRNQSKALILVILILAEKRLTKINLKTKESESKIINNENIDNYQTILFSEGNNIILSSSKQYYNITNDYKMFLLTGNMAYSQAMNTYFDKIYDFRRQLKFYRVKYNILKNIVALKTKKGAYDTNYLFLNDFLIEDEYIKLINQSKHYYTIKASRALIIEKKQTLVLKRRGNQALSIVKYLNTHFKFDLKEAKNLIESTPSVIANGLLFENAERFKKDIEELGATCYLKTDYFESKDGSTIHIKNGQLIFNSSKTFIPTFYITSVLNHRIAMATHSEFAGNTYYLPVNHKLTTIDIKEFYKKYINPFLTQIIEHED